MRLRLWTLPAILTRDNFTKPIADNEAEKLIPPYNKPISPKKEKRKGKRKIDP